MPPTKKAFADILESTQDKLIRSTDQREVAVALSTVMFRALDSVDEGVLEKLKELRDIVWELPRAYHAPKQRDDFQFEQEKRARDEAKIKNIIASTDKEELPKLLDAYAKLGHIYELAGHLARENFFQRREKEFKEFLKKTPDKIPDIKQISPGGLHQLLFMPQDADGEVNPVYGKSVSETIGLLSQSVFEPVFTQHPTNTNTLSSIKAQRALALAAEGLLMGKGKWSDLNKTMQQFVRQPLTDAKNFNVQQETEMVVHFLSNAFHDIDRVYDVADRALERKFGLQYDDMQKNALDFKMRFSSWGSAGDKDGNQNIKSENTLEAIIMHKKRAAELYAEALKDMPALAEWKANFDRVARDYAHLEQQLETKRNGNEIPLTREEFVAISGLAKSISGSISLGDFQKALKNEGSEKARSVLRKTRIFGLSLGKIEYRETAEEYSRAMNHLLTNAGTPLKEQAEHYTNAYAHIQKLKEDAAKEGTEPNPSSIARYEHQQEAAMKVIMNDDALRAALIKAGQDFMAQAEGSALRDYKDKDPKKAASAILYHSLRRMELARDFDDMITHNVLAECKGTHNLLEALALQHASTENGKRAHINIVPLFEEADTMKKIGEVIEGGANDPAYQEHLRALGMTQQVQIAHSDNARRAGAIGSRGVIHKGHRVAREAVEHYNKTHPEEPLQLQFYEGGSQSDSYRNGVRAISAMVKDFRLEKFAKMTFQGGDLLNYFNVPSSSERLLVRQMVTQAKLQATTEHKTPFAQEGKVVQALTQLEDQYESNHFDNIANPLGKLLAALGYRHEVRAGGAGSRAAGRVASAIKEWLVGVAAKVIRTIGFSETLQHGSLHPTCIGTLGLEGNLETLLGKQLSPTDLHTLYKESPAFQDVIDKMAYSVINTDMISFKNRLQRMPRDKTLALYTGQTLPEEYLKAADLAYRALTGDTLDARNRKLLSKKDNHGEDQFLRFERMKHLLMSHKKMEHYAALRPKNRYLWALNQIQYSYEDPLIAQDQVLQKRLHLDYAKLTSVQREEYKAELEHKNGGPLDAALTTLLATPQLTPEQGDALNQGIEKILDQDYEGMMPIRRLIHNARDTVHHGRTFVADDPTYGKALVAENRNRDVGTGIA